MEIITSTQNTRVKRIVSLKSAKGRDAEGVFFAEGVKILSDNKDRILELFIREDKLDEYVPIFPDVPVVSVTEAVFQKMSDTDTPQGILGTFRIPEGDFPSGRRILVLDGVQDPGNVGALIRTAVAAGLDGVVAVDSASPYSPKAVRASMGGVFRTVIARATREEALSRLAGRTVVVLDMGGENLFNARVDGDFALVVGSEGRGLSEAFRSRADRVLALPMAGGIESLNAAVSAGIAMYNLSEFNKEI